MNDCVKTAKRETFSLSLQASILIPVLSLNSWRQILFCTLVQWLASSNSTLSYYIASVTDIPGGRHVPVISFCSCLQTDWCYTGGRRGKKKKKERRNQLTQHTVRKLRDWNKLTLEGRQQDLMKFILKLPLLTGKFIKKAYFLQSTLQCTTSIYMQKQKRGEKKSGGHKGEWRERERDLQNHIWVWVGFFFQKDRMRHSWLLSAASFLVKAVVQPVHHLRQEVALTSPPHFSASNEVMSSCKVRNCYRKKQPIRHLQSKKDSKGNKKIQPPQEFLVFSLPSMHLKIWAQQCCYFEAQLLTILTPDTNCTNNFISYLCLCITYRHVKSQVIH